MQERNIIREVLFPVMIVFFSSVLTILFFSWHEHLSFKSAYFVILENLFPTPDVNGFYGENKDVYLMIFAGIVISILLSKTLEFVCVKVLKQNRNGERVSYKDNRFALIVIILIIIMMAQMTQHYKYVSQRYKLYSGRSYMVKKVLLFGFRYFFAMNCRISFRGYHSAKFITDMDMTRSTHMTTHRILSYFLYPINIRKNGGIKKPDCLVFYQKKNAINLVPDDYYIKYQFSESNILAVRKILH